MYFAMTVEKTKIGYCAPIAGLHMERQEHMARESGCSKIYRRDEARSADVRGRWMRVLRPGDVAWVADIRVLCAPKKDRGSVAPSLDFHATLRRVEATGAVIEDGRTGITSADGERWIELIEWASTRLWSAQRKQVEVNKALRKAREAKPMGVERMWKSKTMEDQRKAAASIYFDARFSRAENVRRLPEPLCHMSVITAWRIFKDLASEHAPKAEQRKRKQRRKRRTK